MKNELIKIKDIEVEDNLYPRENYNWQTGYDYSESMKAGAEFPPICVARVRRGLRTKLILVDGRHRIEANKICKNEYISSEVLTGLNDKEIYLEAIKRNIGHGRQFSPYEKRKIIIKLTELKIDRTLIGEIIGIQLTKLDSFVGGNLKNEFTTGKNILVKAPFKKLDSSMIPADMENIQRGFNIGTQVEIVNQVINLFEYNLIDKKNKALMIRLKVLKELFKEYKIK